MFEVHFEGGGVKREKTHTETEFGTVKTCHPEDNLSHWFSEISANAALN